MPEPGSGGRYRAMMLSGRGLQFVDDLTQYIDDHDQISDLCLDRNQLSDLYPFPCHLCHIQVLDLSHNLIYTLHRNPFHPLHHLRCLNLAHNAIVTIEGLNGLPLLQHLDLSHNSIRRIQGLNDLIQLQSLNLSFNEIERIDDLSANVSLQVLNLSSNVISSLHQISDLMPSTLQSLNLSCNAISSIQSLTFLSGMNELQALDCEGNPFTISAASANYNYRSFISFLLPSLALIDGSPPTPMEMQEGQRLFCELDGDDLSTDLLQLLDRDNDDQLQAYLQSMCPIRSAAFGSNRSDVRENLDQLSSSKLVEIGESNSHDLSLVTIYHYDHESFFNTLRSINASLSAVLESVPSSGLSRWNLKSVAAIVIQSHWRRKRIQSVYKQYISQMRRSRSEPVCNIAMHRILQRNACQMHARLKQALDEIATLKQRLDGDDKKPANVLV